MNSASCQIENGSRVAVIGGGPAGSFFALYLRHFAQQKGISPSITIFQQRDFERPGTGGCKGCAGVLSLHVMRHTGELDIDIPDEIIQTEIEHYTVHSPFTTISISNPEKDIHIVSVYRGRGPRLFNDGAIHGFDEWLLNQARERGAAIKMQKVTGIFLGDHPEIEVEGNRSQYDLVVLATGVNGKAIPIKGLDYIPPKTQVMSQDELYLGNDAVQKGLGNAAHAFLVPHSGLIFGALVPKGPFVNVSILNRSDQPVSVADFLNYDIVRNSLPGHYEQSCGCRPRAAISPARNYYTDRFLTVGDAAVSRLYKDGIGSSMLMAQEAARTVVSHGVSRHDFEKHYRPLCNSIAGDNKWGRRLFRINDMAKNSRTFMLAQQRLISDEQNNVKGPQPFTRAAWGMFTGSYSYTAIARMVLSPVSLMKLSGAFCLEGFKLLFRMGTGAHKSLYVGGRKVLILGSGFGGTYVLRGLVPALNRNEHVETTMVSEENYFLFSPLLHEVATGRIETRHIAYPVRRLQWRDRFNFIQANVEKIDLANRKVITGSGALDYDFLVLALGSTTDTSGLGSYETSVFTLKTLNDSMKLRNHIIELFEQANTERDPERQKELLTFVVAGGGYTGVQLICDLRDFIFRTLLKLYRSVDPANIKIVVVEMGPKIAGELHTKLGAYLVKHLVHIGVEVRLKSRITRVREHSVEINGADNVPTRMLIWVAGVAANPRIAELPLEKDGMGRIMVNEYGEVNGYPGVYAVGDCAHFTETATGKAVQPRAHAAVREARLVAHNLLAAIRGRDRKPFRYADTTEIVSLGASKAVFRFHGIRLYGLPARFIWLLGYSILITGGYNRIRIFMDWTLAVVFGRDTTLVRREK